MTESNTNDTERRLDELIALIGGEIKAEDRAAQIINPTRVRQLEFVFEALKILLEGQDVTITSKLNSPFKSVGSVSVEGKSIRFFKPDWFERIAKCSSNVEIYPLTSGKLRMTFTFHGLTVPM